ncbi:cobalamin B12-binding domain-containing protein [Roseicyclus marinus]|nr:cobalamin-dependent protein [Roseicyclus marinus]
MAEDAQSFDPDLFLSAADIFARKGRTLPIHAVKGFATEVVQRILSMDARAEFVDDAKVSAKRLGAFCDTLLQPLPEKALAFVAALEAEGVTPDVIRYGYIAGAARLLGDRWDRNKVDFTEVAIATGRLYALIRAVKPDHQEHHGVHRGTRSALFASVPGETHTLGITLAADTFRNHGWDIDLRVSEDHDSLVRLVQHARPAVIGLSLSTRGRLADLIRLVLALRIVVPRAIIGVAPALEMSDTEITDIVDIDLVFRDARTALADLDRLLRLRA